MSSDAHVVHRMPGRVRFRVPSRKGDATYFEEVARTLRDAPGVSSVRVSPPTGAVLVHHEGPLDALQAFAEARGAFEVGEPPAASARPVLSIVAAELATVDGRLRDATEGRWGLGSLAFYGLLGASAVQVLRGNYLPAASSLLYQAMNVLQKVSAQERAE